MTERERVLPAVLCAICFILAPLARAETDTFLELERLDAEEAAASTVSLEEFTAPCPRPVDPKKVAVFIDTNSAYREVKIAKDAACAQGYRFETLPSLEAIYQSGVPMETLGYARDRKGYYEELCKSKPDQCDQVKLLQIQKDYADKESAAAVVGAKYAYSPGARFKDLAARLSAESARVHWLVVSGHHYEYAFYGDYLTPERLHDDERGPYGSDVAPVARAYPQVFSELTAIGMWGCAGVTARKIEEWRRYFPSVRLMGGYNNTAPSSLRPDNLAFLKGYLSRISSLLRATTASAARAMIASIPAIHSSFSGVYLQLASGDEYLYQVLAPRNGASGARWQPLAVKSKCDSFLARLPGWVERLKHYEDGTIAIPVDVDGSELKRIYFDLQINSDCYKDRPEAQQYNSPRVGLLRFFETGIKVNFAAKFTAELDQATAELRSKHYRVIAQGSKKKPAPPKLFELDIGAAPALQVLNGLKMTEFILLQPRARILALEQALARVQPLSPGPREVGTRKIEWIRQTLKRLLVELHPECTEMLMWHQPRIDHPPAVSCSL